MSNSILSKLNFELGRNPRVEVNRNWKYFIPENYKCVITFTADFELAWAPRYSKSFKEPLKKSIELAIRERNNVKYILDLCEKFNIPITWATVGHLFLEKCDKVNNLPHPNIPRPNFYENEYWRFDGNDWFEYDPCSNYLVNPEWYAPDLINLILSSHIKHEIGCHTFSHIDCREEVCSEYLFRAELEECIKHANKFNVKLKSFVHPGHTIGHLNLIKEYGFKSFQTDYKNTLGYPQRTKYGIWEIKRTMELTYRNDWSVEYHLYRYKTVIERGIKFNSVCNFWFHPSFEEVMVTEILPELFSFIDERRDLIYIANVSEYIEWLERNYV